MPDAHKNLAYSTVATAPSPATSGTSLVVAAADGTKFPAVPFNATIWPVSAQPTTANAEIVRVTTISTDTLTITRAQENTSARTVVVGDQIAATVTAKTLTDVENLVRSARSSNTILAAADNGTLIDATAGYTQTLTAAATLGAGWWCYIKNDTTDGTSLLAIDPNGSETIDGLTTLTLYSGDTRLVICDGANFFTTLIDGGFARFTANGTFTVPSCIQEANVDCVGPGGGGGGGRGAAAGTNRIGGGGGGGGARVQGTFRASDLGAAGATVTVTVPAGGAGGAGGINGTSGANTTFGTLVLACGGGGGALGGSTGTTRGQGGGGGGAGELGQLPASGSVAGRGGMNIVTTGTNGIGGQGGTSSTAAGNASAAEWGGGCGGISASDVNSYGLGGTSLHGGTGGGAGGGANATNTVQGGTTAGAAGAWTPNGGGATGGTGGATGGGLGGTGANGNGLKSGEGGGGGGGNNGAGGGNGGPGGIPGGGGGGGGGATTTGGTGGNGGNGECRVWYT